MLVPAVLVLHLSAAPRRLQEGKCASDADESTCTASGPNGFVEKAMTVGPACFFDGDLEGCATTAFTTAAPGDGGYSEECAPCIGALASCLSSGGGDCMSQIDL